MKRVLFVCLHISEDWQLPDPHGQPIEGVRPVRDAVRQRVAALVDEIAAGQERKG
jgi:arsenate reductase